MNIQIPYQEIKSILFKKLKGGVSIEKIEYVNDKTVKVTIYKSISLLSANVPISADLCVMEFYRHNVVVDLNLDGLAGVWQKIASIKWINESHLEWLLREVFDLGGLVSIDDNNRNRLTIHLDKIDALKSTLEVLEFKGLSFNNAGAEFVAEAL